MYRVCRASEVLSSMHDWCFERMSNSLCCFGESGLWLAGNEGMEKNVETTIMGVYGVCTGVYRVIRG